MTIGTIVPTPGWQHQHTDSYYDDARSLIYPSGIEVMPHHDGLDGGWFWRIDLDVARVASFNDWNGPLDTAEAAFAAAMRFLVSEAARWFQLEDALFAPGVDTAEDKLAVLDQPQFFPRFVPIPAE
jgi:hypothetical protein